MRLLRTIIRCNVLRDNEVGMTILETMLALAIVGLTAVGFSTGLAIASKSTLIADQRNTAQSIAQSQVENIKLSGYIDFSDPGHGDYALIAAPSGYSVESTTTPIDSDTGLALPSGEDEGLQKIVVTVNHSEESVFTLEAYKEQR